MIGLALYVIGYVGVFFGNLIKAAVSRQREFLGRCFGCAVHPQPEGIAGALKKIGALAEGSRIADPHAEEASHMFFGEAVGGLNELFGLLATHPPLVERIRRIDPSFTGDFSQVSVDMTPQEAPQTSSTRSSRRTRPGVMGLTAARPLPVWGRIDQAHIDYAADLKESMPQSLTESVRDPLGARRWSSPSCSIPAKRFGEPSLPGWMRTPCPPRRARPGSYMRDAQRLAPEARLPLVEMAAPALCQMTPAQFHDFIRCVEALVHADHKMTLFEYALQRLLIRHVVTYFVALQAPGCEVYDDAPFGHADLRGPLGTGVRWRRHV